MKKNLAIALVVIYLCGLAGCSQKDDEVLHLGLNATIVEIDASNHILYVTDLGNDEIFGARCAIDCNEAIEKNNLCYVNYDAEDDVRTIEFDDFQVGDAIIIGLYNGEKEKSFNKSAVAEQVQLATQRLNFACGNQTPERTKTIESDLRTYYEMSDGTWECDGHTYKYRLESSRP